MLRVRLLLRLRLPEEGVEVLVHRPLQLAHQALELLVGGVSRERVLQCLLQIAQIALCERDATVLEVQSGVPEQPQDFVHRLAVLIQHQAHGRRAQRQIDGRVVLEELRRPAQVIEGGDDVLALLWLGRQATALLDQGPRHRMLERALRQDQLLRFALATLVDAIDRLEAHDHRQPGPGVRRQVEIGGIVELGRAAGGPHQLDPLDPLIVAEQADQHRDAADAVVVIGEKMRAQHTPLGHRRRLGEFDRRRLIGDRLDLPRAELLALAADAQTPRVIDHQGSLGAGLADRDKRLFVAVQAERELSGRCCQMMQLGERLAAGRQGHGGRRAHDHRLAGARALDLEPHRRPACVDRRGHPQSELHGHLGARGRRLELEGLNQASGRHAAGVDQGNQKQQQ